MNDQSEIYRPASRSTNHIGLSGQIAAAPEPGRPTRIDVDGWIIEVMGDAVIVKSVGAVTTSMRTGELGQVVVRRDPPPASARRTELVK